MDQSSLGKELIVLINEYGLQSILQGLVENFDYGADLANSSGDKKIEDNYRKVAVILFDAQRRLDSV